MVNVLAVPSETDSYSLRFFDYLSLEEPTFFFLFRTFDKPSSEFPINPRTFWVFIDDLQFGGSLEAISKRIFKQTLEKVKLN